MHFSILVNIFELKLWNFYNVLNARLTERPKLLQQYHFHSTIVACIFLFWCLVNVRFQITIPGENVILARQQVCNLFSRFSLCTFFSHHFCTSLVSTSVWLYLMQLGRSGSQWIVPLPTPETADNGILYLPFVACSWRLTRKVLTLPRFNVSGFEFGEVESFSFLN